VALAAEEERRCFDPVGLQEGIRDLHVSVERFPQRPDFMDELDDVLVGAVERQWLLHTAGHI